MIGNRCIVTLLLSAALLPTTVQGQSLFDQYRQQKQKQFDDYKARKQKEFDEYRRRKNEEFAEYMRQRWPEFEEEAPIEKPKEDKDVPPVVLPKEDRDKPIETKPVPIEEVVAPPPAPKPQPEPVAPIEEKPQPQVQYVQFTFYGTPCKHLSRGAAVAAGISPAIAEIHQRNQAVIGAPVAIPIAVTHFNGGHLIGRNDRTPHFPAIRALIANLFGMIASYQCRAYGAHEVGRIGPHHLNAGFKFESPEHRIRQECASLDDNLAAKVLSLILTDDPVKHIPHHGIGNSGSNVGP